MWASVWPVGARPSPGCSAAGAVRDEESASKGTNQTYQHDGLLGRLPGSRGRLRPAQPDGASRHTGPATMRSGELHQARRLGSVEDLAEKRSGLSVPNAPVEVGSPRCPGRSMVVGVRCWSQRRRSPTFRRRSRAGLPIERPQGAHDVPGSGPLRGRQKWRSDFGPGEAGFGRALRLDSRDAKDYCADLAMKMIGGLAPT